MFRVFSGFVPFGFVVTIFFSTTEYTENTEKRLEIFLCIQCIPWFLFFNFNSVQFSRKTAKNNTCETIASFSNKQLFCVFRVFRGFESLLFKRSFRVFRVFRGSKSESFRKRLAGKEKYPDMIFIETSGGCQMLKYKTTVLTAQSHAVAFSKTLR